MKTLNGPNHVARSAALAGFWQDLRLGWRALARGRVSALTAVATFALRLERNLGASYCSPTT